MARKNNRPTDAQMDARRIETSKVQFWQHGVMVTAQVSNADARLLVTLGKAFVITPQAIGALKDGEYDD